jgi:chemotaxis protein methyltransferase CheR
VSLSGPTLSEQDFKAFARLVHDKAGINLHEGKRELVRARLASTIREGQFRDFREYYDHIIQDRSGDELVKLLDSISTNLTNFFREPGHFAFMAKKFLPELEAEQNKRGENQLRIWSAGCSTGEEPYSIAITVLDHAPYFGQGEARILATDLSTRVLDKAAQGIYAADRVSEMPRSILQKHFRKGRGAWEGCYRVRESTRGLVVFRRLNLIEKLPFKKRFNLIFCRNVMIYFDKETQARLVGSFYDALAPGGYLFIGHSESLTGLGQSFKYIQPTIYRK